MNKSTAVKIDNKGRISIPSDLRENLGFNPGDIIFLKQGKKGLMLAKALNPFDILAEDAIKQHKEKETISLRDFAKKQKLNLDD